ncbi:MAG: YceI family protein, partial [Candidatus Limnocylindria bacterium]
SPAAAPTTAAPTTPPASTGNTWEVTDQSKVTVRVNEQLANVSAPNDAVLSTNAVSGAFELRADGTFTADSKITVDLTTLRSDRSQRDDFIRSNTLETDRFPKAEFAPTRTAGLALPLPASGEFTFALTGKMTIHGVEKETTFDVTAKRAGGELTATATANPSFVFGDFGMEQPRVLSVLSVQDEIRLEVELVARLR